MPSVNDLKWKWQNSMGVVKYFINREDAIVFAFQYGGWVRPPVYGE